MVKQERMTHESVKKRIGKVFQEMAKQITEHGIITNFSTICKEARLGGQYTVPFRETLEARGILQKHQHGAYFYFPKQIGNIEDVVKEYFQRFADVKELRRLKKKKTVEERKVKKEETLFSELPISNPAILPMTEKSGQQLIELTLKQTELTQKQNELTQKNNEYLKTLVDSVNKQ